jgi:hypothetical protein
MIPLSAVILIAVPDRPESQRISPYQNSLDN